MHTWLVGHYDVLRDFASPAVALIGLAVTAIIAGFGFRTFSRWKREKIEERRIEVALDALAIAYEARFRFEGIRSRILYDDEYADIDEQSGSTEYPVMRHRSEQREPYAILKRLRSNREFFDRVFNVEPRLMAIFGAETQEIFELLYEAKVCVESSANALYEEAGIEHDSPDSDTRERMRKLRVDVFASKGKIEKDDKVGQKILEFQKRIEALCRPIVDETFGRRGVDTRVL